MRTFLPLGIFAVLCLAACLPAELPSPIETVTASSPAPNSSFAGDQPLGISPGESGNSKLDRRPVPEMPEPTAVITIPMVGDITQRSAELSGLAWYGDWLILLPQYPDFPEKKENGRLFALPRADLLAYLDGQIEGPLQPLEIPFVAPDVALTVPGYEGFEAIAFVENEAFLAIEASPSWGMIGYLVKGEIAPDLSQLELDTSLYVPLPSASGENNKADEALLVTGDEVLSIHEANGAAVNEMPAARRFDRELQSLGTVPFPPIEYRITDVTDLDADGRFWAVNYFFPGELALRPDSDPIAKTYGEVPTRGAGEGVARLLQLQYATTGITLIDQPPLQLEIDPLALHNWEGIVRLDDRGFLLVTDKFPNTILGFVPYP